MITAMRQASFRSPGRGIRPGFTLVELVVTMGAMSVLMTGIASAIVLASRAMDVEDDSIETVDAGWALRQMSDELSCAVSVASRSATMIEFAVPDRDSDDTPEIILYEWSGTGTNLTRTYNGGTAVPMVAEVEQFAMDYTYYTHSVAGDPTETEGPEVIFADHYPGGGIQNGYSIQSALWVSQYIQPTLPANTVRYSIRGVHLIVRGDGPLSGGFYVQIRQANKSGEPTDVRLAQTYFPESILSYTPFWWDVPLSGLDSIDPDASLCVCLVHDSGFVSASAQYEHRPGDNTGNMWTTTTGGSTWWKQPEMDLCHAVYGTITTSTTGPSIDTNFLTDVRITLQPGESVDSLIETSVAVYNTPQFPD